MTSQHPHSSPVPARGARGPLLGRGRRARERGIALLVVMVVFVVLYLVVYQLHFSTSMEAKIAGMRYGEMEAATAMHSIALFAMSYLVEDLQQGSQGGADAAMAAEGPRNIGEDREKGGAGKARQPAEGTGGEVFTPLPAAGGAGGAGWYDYLTEALFQPMVKQVGQTSVKMTIRDNEGKIDLNRLFDYVRLKDEEITAGAQDISEEELVTDVAGKTEEEAEKSLKKRLSQKRLDRKQAREKDRTSRRKGGSETAAAGEGIGSPGEVGAEAATPATEAMSEYELEEEFVEPTPEQVEATRQMLDRALEMAWSINEQEYGLPFQSGIRYSSSEIANAIVQYVLERRRNPAQNRIYLVSELLNIPEISPEVFYGSWPPVRDGVETPAGDGFLLRRDEFGDIVPEDQMGLVDPEMASQERERIHELERDYGQFFDFAQFGISANQANPMTRGMAELPLRYNHQTDETYAVERPIPIGLKDLFTTFSTGKVNINTAPAPVLYGLLLSCTDGPGGEAQVVAFNIRDYRNLPREEASEEGVERVGTGKEAPDLGQPKRTSRRKSKEAGGTGTGTGTATGTGAGTGIEPEIDPLTGEPLEETEPEMNYFTNLDQLELIDGTDGGPQDQMRRDEGVERVSEERDTLFRRVIHDLEKVAVFGSTNFTVELKAKPQKGRSLKVGSVTIRRDPKKGRCEILMWKNLEK